MSHDDYEYCKENGHRFADLRSGSGVDYAQCNNCLAVRVIQSWVGQIVGGDWKIKTAAAVIIEDPRIAGVAATITDLPEGVRS